jgi:hypothetical protein
MIALPEVTREAHRRIPLYATNKKILDALDARYGRPVIVEQDAFDLYFQIVNGLPEGLRIRERGGFIQATLKVPEQTQIPNIYQGVEAYNPAAICDVLDIRPVVNNVEELIAAADRKYGRDFILHQHRTLASFDGTRISLDAICFHEPTRNAIPPIRNAVGKLYFAEGLYEAEGTNKELLQEATQHLVSLGLAGAPLEKTKEQMGREILQNIQAFRRSKMGRY